MRTEDSKQRLVRLARTLIASPREPRRGEMDDLAVVVWKQVSRDAPRNPTRDTVISWVSAMVAKVRRASIQTGSLKPWIQAAYGSTLRKLGIPRLIPLKDLQKDLDKALKKARLAYAGIPLRIYPVDGGYCIESPSSKSEPMPLMDCVDWLEDAWRIHKFTLIGRDYSLGPLQPPVNGKKLALMSRWEDTWTPMTPSEAILWLRKNIKTMIMRGPSHGTNR